MQLFSGVQNAQILDKQIALYLSKQAQNSIGTLGIIQVGNDPASSKYTELKLNYCKKINIPAEYFKIDESLSDLEIGNKIEEITSISYLTSVILQLPLPRKSLDKLIQKIPPEKDVDCLLGTNFQFLQADSFKTKSRYSPIIRAGEYFLYSNNIKLARLETIIIGDGLLVGNPIKNYLISKGAIVKVIDNYKIGYKLVASLVILSTGISNLVKGEDLQDGCNVIDFGSSILNGKTCGDLDMNSQLQHLGTISPSPGGMGSLVIRFLVMNHLGI